MRKIAFDGKRAFQNFTGLGNYSRYVVEILAKYYPQNSYLLYAPKVRLNNRLEALIQSPSVDFASPKRAFSRAFSSLWRFKGICSDIKKDNVSLYHGLSAELPYGINRVGIPSVVTIHDLIFLRYPSYYSPLDRWIYKKKAVYACKHANKVIAISECTKRDIVTYLNIPSEKIEVVYQGCHPIFKTEVSTLQKENVAMKYSLPQNFVLCVGTIEERKNLLLAVRSLKHLPNDIHLVAVGRPTKYLKTVQQWVDSHHLNERFHVLSGVPLEELVALYALAKVFVYPSRFEGFGIPIIEALCQGVPVVAATGSCLEEAGGAHSLYVNPDDDEALAKHIQAICLDLSLAKNMIQKGYEHAQRFDDKRIADQLIALYTCTLSE